MRQTSRSCVLLVAFLAGCGQSEGYCTLIGCGWDESAVFSFSERGGAWAEEQEAAYVFAVTFDGVEHVCSGGVTGDWSCDDGLTMDTFQSGMGDAAFQGVDALRLDRFPGPTQLRVERDGVVVHQQDYDIVEEVTYPNGEDCEPECNQWVASVSW